MLSPFHCLLPQAVRASVPGGWKFFAARPVRLVFIIGILKRPSTPKKRKKAPKRQTFFLRFFKAPHRLKGPTPPGCPPLSCKTFFVSSPTGRTKKGEKPCISFAKCSSGSRFPLFFKKYGNVLLLQLADVFKAIQSISSESAD